MVLLIAPRTCESDIDYTGPGGNRTKVWTVHQPSSLGDVQYLSFICIKACELFFVDIGEHRKRLIAIPVLRWAGQQKSFLSITHNSVSSVDSDHISSMGGDFLDVTLVREASKSTMIYNTTH